MSDEQLDQRVAIQREVSFQLAEEGDGRTLEARIVPYNTPTEVSDPPFHVPYVETWAPGAFDRQLRAANRVDVLLNWEHQEGIGGVVGRGTQLRSDDDALYGTFRVLPGPDGDKTLELIRSEVATGMSVEAIPIKSVRTEEGILRQEARLRNVAVCRSPAFPEAKVLAVRQQAEEGNSAEVGGNWTINTTYSGTVIGGIGTTSTAVLEPIKMEPVTIDVEPAARSAADEALARYGWEPLVQRAVVDRPWDGSASRFTDEQYQRSCVIDRGGDAPVKERCSLPVLEPNGDLNVNGLAAAAGRLAQVTGINPAMRAAAARKLVRYYRQANMPPPQSLRAAAAR